MITFGRRNQRKKLIQVETHLARIVDLDEGQRQRSVDRRSARRTNLNMPVLVVPWMDGRANVEKQIVGLTKDIGERSASVLLSHPLQYRELLIGFCASSAHSAASPPPVSFFLANVRHNSALPSGFWQMGLTFTEYANATYPDEVQSLIPIANHLLGA